MTQFYRPSEGWLADVTPFIPKSVARFYLKDCRDEVDGRQGTP
jgi:hypothetical protein